MTQHWLSSVNDILRSDKSDLRSLANMAGVEPERLYVGINLDGVDLRGQDLRGMRFSVYGMSRAIIDDKTLLDPDIRLELSRINLIKTMGGQAHSDELALAPLLSSLVPDEPSGSIRSRFLTGWLANLWAVSTPDGDVRRPASMGVVEFGDGVVRCAIAKKQQVQADKLALTTTIISEKSTALFSAGVALDQLAGASAVAEVVSQAEAIAGIRLSGVTVCTSGGGLASERVNGDAALRRRAIDDVDCNRAIGDALAKVRLPGRRPIHLLPISWRVDSRGGIRDPRGAVGEELGVEIIVVSMDEDAFSSIGKCIQRAKLIFEGVVASPYVAGLVILEDKEIDDGAIVIEVDSRFTSVAIFHQGALAQVLSVGPKTGSEIVGEHRDPKTNKASLDSKMLARATLEFAMLKSLIDPYFQCKSDTPVVVIGQGVERKTVLNLAKRIFGGAVRAGKISDDRVSDSTRKSFTLAPATGALYRAAFGPREVVTAQSLISPFRGVPVAGGRTLASALRWFRENF